MVFFLVLTAAALAPPPVALAQANPQFQTPTIPPGQTIDSIRFEGNRKYRSQTLLARIFSRPGDPLTGDALERDFQALWNTQYFEDIRLELEDSPNNPNAKIVIFYMTERPTIRHFDFKGNKSVSESDILDAWKDRKVGLSVESQFDPTRIKKAAVVIKELLASHGRQFATVKPTYEVLPGTSAVLVTFNVDEGPKVKVGRIIFEGNAVFSSRRLERAMRHSRPYGVSLSFLGFFPVLSKTYDHDKLLEDLEVGVRGLYQDDGYFKVNVGDPITQTVDINRGGIPGPWPLVGRKHGKATNVTIKIEEGVQYRMGTLHIRSADVDKGLTLKPSFLESIFPIKKGDLFNLGKIRKALEDYTKLYGTIGFIDFTSTPETDIDEKTKTINLTLVFDEQKQYFVRRIEFSGNTTTRDKVIRREILLSEGDRFNNHLWEISLLRLNQLDYFNEIKPENAELKKNVKEGTVDILLKVQEKGKQSISLTGGVSGISGSYIGLSYQTNNLLGRGETLTLAAQLGDVQRSLQFGFTEPYLFDRPISTGFTIFSSRYNFDQARQESILLGRQIQLNPNTVQNYTQNSSGFTVYGSYPLRHFGFARLGLSYGLTNTNIQALSTSANLLFTILKFQSVAGPSAIDGIRSSRLVPSITYNTVDNPVNPTSGKSIFVSASVEGGPLGGNVNTLTEVVSLKYFHPINHKRNVLGFNFTGAFASGFGGKEITPYSRFYLGGEQDLRGFDVRTVSPVAFIPVATSTSVSIPIPGNILNGFPATKTVSIPTLGYQISFPGGDTQGVLNFEYRIPIVSHVGISIFHDIGAVGNLKPNQLQLDPTGLAALRQQFPGAFINSELQLQRQTNFRIRASAGVEFVVQLPIVQAPFRLYWAYNYKRMAQVISAPVSYFDPATLNAIKASLPAYVYDAYVQPQIDNLLANPQRTNFFDPLKTFRFTISRTF